MLFSSEKYCWPDKSLEKEYPKSDNKKYLNSGAFIGYAPSVYSLVSHTPVDNEDDDQLYYTQIYLDKELRTSIGIKLDLSSRLFQNLNGALHEVEVRFIEAKEITQENADAFLYNKVHQTKPSLIHGNGNSKIPLNSLGNYLAKSWHPAVGCLTCFNSTSQKRIEARVLIAINILKPTPFLDLFLEDVSSLEYPLDKISVFIQSATNFHDKELETFQNNFQNLYESIRVVTGVAEKEWQMRNRYM